MTAHRRPLFAFAATAALFLPACLFISGPGLPISSEPHDKVGTDGGTRPAEQVRRDKFGELLPARPGGSVAVKPAGKDTTTAQRPAGTPPAIPGADAPGTPTPATPHGAVKPASDPPEQFPLAAFRPPPPEPPLLAAMRAWSEGRADRAIEILKALDLPNQEFVLAVLPALASGATADLATDPRAVAVLAEQLRAAARQLENRAPLLVENLALCRRVSGFGRYDLWPEGRPYRPNDQAQLYLEVRNLVSQPGSGPHGETHLTHVLATVEVKDAHGVRVDQPDPEDPRRRVPVVRFEKKLFSRGPVDDFHVLYTFPVPQTPGVYTISVELRDPASRRSVRTNPIEFRVSGP